MSATISEASHSASGANERRLMVQLPLLVEGILTTSNCTSRHNGCRSSAWPTRTLISSMLAGVFAKIALNSIHRLSERRTPARSLERRGGQFEQMLERDS